MKTAWPTKTLRFLENLLLDAYNFQKRCFNNFEIEQKNMRILRCISIYQHPLNIVCLYVWSVQCANIEEGSSRNNHTQLTAEVEIDKEPLGLPNRVFA